MKKSAARQGDILRSVETKIEFLPISTLKPYEQNARVRSKRQVREIARSIERFGFTNPVLIDANKQIICGHGRAAAAQLIGLKKVPTIKLEHLSDAEKRAYILADNKLAEKAGWDREILAIELQALVDMDFEIELTGFEMAEVDFILDEATEIKQAPLLPEDSVPEVSAERPVTKRGDLWLLGAHRLYCGDARDERAYGALMKGTKADFVFTDPPYNVPIDGHVSGLGRIKHRDFAMACGEMSQAEYTTFLEKVFRLLCALTESGSIHDICIDWRHIFELLVAGRAVYHELKNICIWNKSNAGMGSFYRSQHELVLIWKNGSAPHINNFDLVNMVDRERIFGITRASILSGANDLLNSPCIRRSSRLPLYLMPSGTARAAVALFSIPSPAVGPSSSPRSARAARRA